MQFLLSECAPSDLLPFAPLDLTFTWKDETLVHVDIKEGAGTVFVSGTQNDVIMTKKWLTSYFQGKNCTIRLPKLSPVQARLLMIPFATTTTYGELAGDKKGARGVGRACGANKMPLVIPCHRVVAKNGSLCGFNRGLSIKEILLTLEQKINSMK